MAEPTDTPARGNMKELLTRAMHEIRELRRENEILRAKVEVMDLFACVLNTTAAHRSQGMTEDIAWAIERELARMETEDTARAS